MWKFANDCVDSSAIIIEILIIFLEEDQVFIGVNNF